MTVQIPRLALDACPDAVLAFDPSGRCVYSNPAGQGLLHDATSWGQEIAALVTSGAPRESVLTVGRRHLEARTVHVGAGEDGVPRWIVVFARDVTDAARERAALRGRAARDPLTGLLNHAAFHDLAPARLAQADEASAAPALVLADLDHLKHLNDTHGHAAGDAALQCVADVLRSVVRDEDGLARLGGDEFAWLVTGATEEEVIEVAERAVRAVGAAGPPGRPPLSVSVGIAFRASTAEPGDLFDRADAALYDAKAQGRGVVVVAGDTDIAYASRRPPGQGATELEVVDLSTAEDQAGVARAALREWVAVFAATGGCVDLLDEAGERLRACAYYRFGHDDWTLSQEEYALADYPSTARALERRQPYSCRIDDPDADPTEVGLLEERGWAAILLIPLVAAGRPLGTVELFDARHRSFTAAEKRVGLALGGHLAALLARLPAA